VTATPLPVYSVLPFVAMLLAIAVGPLRVPAWWEHNRNKLLLSAVLGLPVAALYLAREPIALVHRARSTSRSSSCWPGCT
jgi:hypothetical protein